MPSNLHSVRVYSFKATVVFLLGSCPGPSPIWKPIITIPTLASFQPFCDYAARFQLDIEA